MGIFVALSAEWDNVKPVILIVSVMVMIMACLVFAFSTKQSRSFGHTFTSYFSMNCSVRIFRARIGLIPCCNRFLNRCSVLTFISLFVIVFSGVLVRYLFSVHPPLIFVGWIVPVFFAFLAFTFFAIRSSPIGTALTFIEQVNRLDLVTNGAFFLDHKKPPVDWQSVRLSRAYHCRQEAGKTIAGYEPTVKQSYALDNANCITNVLFSQHAQV